MKKNLLLVALLSVFAPMVNTYTKAPVHQQKPEFLGRKQFEGNTQYVYQVTGEDIQDPQKTSKLYAQTNLPYALCSRASCKAKGNNPKKVTCKCPIYGLQGDKSWQKSSVGPKNYRNTKPSQSNGKLTSVVSNYSMANIKDRRNVPQTSCRFRNPAPWANCYGVKCDVKYKYGRPHAVCKCPVVKTKKFVSIGPRNRIQCYQGTHRIWSAATGKQGSNNNDIMTRTYKQ